MFDIENLQIVQALLLMGNYLHSSNRPNRCWNVVGLGIRVALGLGLHIERNSGDLLDQQARRRAWSGCVMMDRSSISNLSYCISNSRLSAMLLGRPVMIHDCDAYSVELPADLDDHFITPLSLISVDNSPSKTSFYIASCKLYRILGDILREFYSASDEYRSMAEETWLCKVSSMMRFDKRLKDWLESLPKYLNWEADYEMPLSDDIVRQRNVLQAAVNVQRTNKGY